MGSLLTEAGSGSIKIFGDGMVASPDQMDTCMTSDEDEPIEKKHPSSPEAKDYEKKDDLPKCEEPGNNAVVIPDDRSC